MYDIFIQVPWPEAANAEYNDWLTGMLIAF